MQGCLLLSLQLEMVLGPLRLGAVTECLCNATTFISLVHACDLPRQLDVLACSQPQLLHRSCALQPAQAASAGAHSSRICGLCVSQQPSWVSNLTIC